MHNGQNKLLKFSIASLLLLIPTLATASDRCTNPDAYTIDRRCYVTGAQKQSTPFNAIVSLSDIYGVYCAGTIVQADNQFVIYTTQHCAQDYMGNVREKLDFVLQNGRTLSATYKDSGWMGTDQWYVSRGNWAVYSIDGNYYNLPHVNLSDGQGRNLDTAKMIGYGSMKIMSDVEINEFKREYMDYLANQNIPSEEQKFYGVNRDNSIDYNNSQTTKFINVVAPLWSKKFMNDRELKVSVCEYNRLGFFDGCQGWKGSAGSGIFDDDNDLMGIYLSTDLTIGGKDHAAAGNSINLQPNIIQEVAQKFFNQEDK